MSAGFAGQVDEVLAQGRELIESLMLDTCTITRPGLGVPVFDNSTGVYTNPPRQVVYTGKCRTQVTSIIANSSSPESGERASVVQGSEFQLPVVGTENVAVKDVIFIITCQHDQALQGRYFTVIARHEKTHATSRRLRVEEVSG